MHGFVPPGVQGFAFPTAELNEVPASSFFQPVKAHLPEGAEGPYGISAIPPSFTSSEPTCSPIFQSINEDVEQDWTQDWSLKYTTGC